MTELIVGVLLAAAKWVFGMLGDNAEKKKRIEKLIKLWMQRMDKEFLASSEMAEKHEQLEKESQKEPWKETGVDIQHPVNIEKD